MYLVGQIVVYQAPARALDIYSMISTKATVYGGSLLASSAGGCRGSGPCSFAVFGFGVVGILPI